ncbi:MAG TPA: peptidyl-alpha-hydroxyglycine alpha-amidating lyase family protein [Bryobacteraceae bacterium]|nr:peptidyl-alpha-hydroxyglycine alpha-amidating lyase family protein [Bryobacteraceae bacterium]
MKRLILLGCGAAALVFAQLAGGPPLPVKLVSEWAKLPRGMYMGEASGVAVDKDDNVWVFNRGKAPVMKFDKTGKLLDTWEIPVSASHGIKIDPEGNVWTVDVFGHSVKKWARDGRMLMVIGNAGAQAGNNESKDAFNRPTGIAFEPNGDFWVSDGYVNSRVVKFNKNGEYVMQIGGKKGTADGEFDTVHDVAIDKRGRIYVADRENRRVQIFSPDGKFLTKWTHLGSPWGFAFNEKESTLYICDGYNSRIVKVNLEGQILGTYGQYGKIPGRFDFVHHMAVDSNGAIYAAEIKNWRVQKFAWQN